MVLYNEDLLWMKSTLNEVVLVLSQVNLLQENQPCNSDESQAPAHSPCTLQATKTSKCLEAKKLKKVQIPEAIFLSELPVLTF